MSCSTFTSSDTTNLHNEMFHGEVCKEWNISLIKSVVSKHVNAKQPTNKNHSASHLKAALPSNMFRNNDLHVEMFHEEVCKEWNISTIKTLFQSIYECKTINEWKTEQFERREVPKRAHKAFVERNKTNWALQLLFQTERNEVRHSERAFTKRIA